MTSDYLYKSPYVARQNELMLPERTDMPRQHELYLSIWKRIGACNSSSEAQEIVNAIDAELGDGLTDSEVAELKAELVRVMS